MKRFATLIATTMLAATMLVAAPGVASAEDTPACPYTYNDVRALELRVIEVEHENWMLRAELWEERDEHTDEINALEATRDKERGEYSDDVTRLERMLVDEQAARTEVEADLSNALETITRRDGRIRRLVQRVAMLRAQLRQ